MDLTPAERAQNVVRYLAKKLQVNQAEIGQKVGYGNRQAFSAVINGKVPFPPSLSERIAALDPEINPAYLYGSSDVMLLAEVEPEAPKEKLVGVFIPGELVQMFTDLSATVRSQQETIRLLMERREEKGSAEAVGL